MQSSVSVLCQSMARTLWIFVMSNELVLIFDHLLSICNLSICWSMKMSPCYVITSADHDQQVPIVIDLFRKYAHLNLCPHYGVNGNLIYRSSDSRLLTRGERRLIETILNLLTMIIRFNANEVFLFEDDAVPHRNFTKLFQQLPKACVEATVLLLGASLTHENRTSWLDDSCFQ